LIRRRIVLGVLLASLFAVGWLAGRGSASGPADLYKNLDVFVEVLQRVQQSYVDVVPADKLMDGAVRGLMHQLDPYSQYLDTKAYADLQSTTQGSFGGVGLIVGIRERMPVVISPVEGGPAWTLGLRTGDILVQIDGKSTQGLALDEVADLLRGKPGTKVTVKVAREGDNDLRDVTIERQVIVTKSVPYAFVLPNDVGYLRLADFSQDAGKEVREAVAQLRARGAKRLVLDLRSNPGGLLDQAVDVSERFVPKGAMLVSTRGRMKGQDQKYYAEGDKPELGWPMVVLVDRGSASAAEIVAGALQDLDRALVVGETSFGKGLVQSLFPLRQGGAVKLTTARYYTPSGRSIHNVAHDRMLLALEDDDNGDDSAVAESLATGPLPADSGTAATYRTKAGRPVSGGGGIRPDVVVAPDSLPPLARAVELNGLAFKVANHWVTTHPGWTLEKPVDDALRAELRSALDSAKVTVTTAEMTAEQPLLDRSLRRELARRLGGDAAAARVALDGDPVLARALAVLGAARGPRDVFAVASRPSAAPPRAASPHASGARR
jgi:carboxyl-terminal processing protease